MKPTHKLLILLPLIGSAAIAQATTVVNYNNPASTLATDRAADTLTTSSHTWNFSDTSLLFNGDAANGQKVYGGYNATSTALNGTTTLTMGTSNLTSQTTKTASGTITVRLFLLYEVEDFVGYTVGNTYAFDQTAASSFTIAEARLNNIGGSFVIRNGSDYYISIT